LASCPPGFYSKTFQCHLCPINTFQDIDDFTGTTCFSCGLSCYSNCRGTAVEFQTITIGSNSVNACGNYRGPTETIQYFFTAIGTCFIVIFLIGLVGGCQGWGYCFRIFQDRNIFNGFSLRMLGFVSFNGILYFVNCSAKVNWVIGINIEDYTPVYEKSTIFLIGIFQVVTNTLVFVWVIIALANGWIWRGALRSFWRYSIPISLFLPDLVIFGGNISLLLLKLDQASITFYKNNEDTGLNAMAFEYTKYRVFDSMLMIIISVFWLGMDVFLFYWDVVNRRIYDTPKDFLRDPNYSSIIPLSETDLV